MKLSQQQNQKIKTYIGFAFKSGACILGTDNILSSKKYEVVLIDVELSENAADKIKRHAEEKNVTVFTLDNLSEVAPKTGVKALGIKNKQLAKAIVETLGNAEIA